MSIKIQKIKPEFIKRKDIRGITPEFLIERFGNRASIKKYKYCKIDCSTVLIERKNQKPDLYEFKNGKFVRRLVSREVKKGSTNYTKEISLLANENGFSTKSSSSNSPLFLIFDTLIETINKPKGLGGIIGLKHEQLNLRLRTEKLYFDFSSKNFLERISILNSPQLQKWSIHLSSKTKNLNAFSNLNQFKAKFSNGKEFNSNSKINLGKNNNQLIKNALKWFDGDFNNR